MKAMKHLTKKEKEIMSLFWKHGEMFVRELQEFYDEPKPHVNTLSTMVRSLEAGGYLGHKAYGSTYQYFPLISEAEYGRHSLSGIIDNYFDKSYISVISTLVREEKVSVDELKDLIAQIEKGREE